ncbi:signalosome subunit 4 [Hesseltinella vesiculosa]|uniref:COP9 signalosome complex subunit 4 n=1 Tax=Hesseltinella vesiculosa TaxID=101127 RepID=A0A1X2GJB7_9FUNG|nr:signalosome subunit 4 [Hesseltinella vesiculosa]
MDLSTEITRCITIPQQQDKFDAFHQVLELILTSGDGNGPMQRLTTSQMMYLQQYVDAILDEQVGRVNARQFLMEFVQLFDTRILQPDSQKQLLMYAINQAQPRVVSFEEPLSLLREKLATIYEQEEEFAEAAKVLQGIALDSGHRTISDEYKLQIYIRIVRLLLEEDDAVPAETYLNRAGLLIPNSQDLLLQMTFKLSQARVLDAKRRFLEACSKYHELSYVSQLDEDERLQCLSAAVQCAVLAGAGPQRSRTLATLYKDERTHQLSSFAILEKTYLERVIRPEERSEFATTLKPHHLAQLADRTTVFDRAMIEHNLLAASKLYNNITFQELAALLNVSSEQAESTAAHMITDRRLLGNIDQVDQLITFASVSHANPSLTNATALAAQPASQPHTYHVEESMKAIMDWDGAIQSMCHDLDSIISQIQEKYPDYAATLS